MTVRAYSPATVVAAKFHAVVSLVLLNSRMKDLHDLQCVPAAMAIDREKLVRSIMATFERRETALPTRRTAKLTVTFAEDPTNIAQWAAYSQGTSLKGVALIDVVNQIWAYIDVVKSDLQNRRRQVQGQGNDKAATASDSLREFCVNQPLKVPHRSASRQKKTA